MPRIPKVKNSFLAVADVHIEKKLFNLPELEADLRQDLVNAINKAIELNVENFIFVGDTYEDMYPSSEAVPFISEEIARLERAGIKTLAIAGDHDKPVDNVSWIVHTNRCLPINATPNFIGVDYDDDPKVVMENLEQAWIGKCMLGHKVEFIFLHGQVQELWPFCEEKKMLPLKEWFLTHELPDLKGIILGDIHKPFEGTLTNYKTKQQVYIGYCGSLGVTRTDEIDKKGYLYYDGTKLSRIPYKLERKYIQIDFTVEWLNALTAAEKDKIITSLKSEAKKPVILLNYTDSAVEQRLSEIAFLYEYALVRRNRLSKKSEQPVSLNLRSELKTNDKIETALRKVDVLKDEAAYNVALRLLRNPEEAKKILDEFKEKALS